MATMVLAAVKVAPETTELRELPMPDIPEDGGILRVEACGVGGSDPEQYRRPTRIPGIMGHEIVGTVEQLGPRAAARWESQPATEWRSKSIYRVGSASGAGRAIFVCA